MKAPTFRTMIAVFEEMFGAGLFRAMVAAALVVTLARFYVPARDRRVGMRKLRARWRPSGS